MDPDSDFPLVKGGKPDVPMRRAYYSSFYVGPIQDTEVWKNEGLMVCVFRSWLITGTLVVWSLELWDE